MPPSTRKATSHTSSGVRVSRRRYTIKRAAIITGMNHSSQYQYARVGVGYQNANTFRARINGSSHRTARAMRWRMMGVMRPLPGNKLPGKYPNPSGVQRVSQGLRYLPTRLTADGDRQHLLNNNSHGAHGQ